MILYARLLKQGRRTWVVEMTEQVNGGLKTVKTYGLPASYDDAKQAREAAEFMYGLHNSGWRCNLLGLGNWVWSKDLVHSEGGPG